MLSRWYLILFIVSLLVLLIILGYNIYENWRIKRDCPESCQESQDILIWLNGLAIFLILVLLLGYFFSDDSSSKQVTITASTNGAALGGSQSNFTQSLQGYSPVYLNGASAVMGNAATGNSNAATGNSAIGNSVTGNATTRNAATGIECTRTMNPFNYGSGIDIISKL